MYCNSSFLSLSVIFGHVRRYPVDTWQDFGRPDDPRPLQIWRVPSHIRDRELEQHEIEAGYYVPDDDVDYGAPFEGVPEGHGTQAAMVAAGMRTGVAREAGLYMIKAGGAVLDKHGSVVEEGLCADALLFSLHHIVDKINDGTLIRGKTIVVIDTGQPHRLALASLGSYKILSQLTAQYAQSGRSLAWKRGQKKSTKSL